MGPFITAPVKKGREGKTSKVSNVAFYSRVHCKVEALEHSYPGMNENTGDTAASSDTGPAMSEYDCITVGVYGPDFMHSDTYASPCVRGFDPCKGHICELIPCNANAHFSSVYSSGTIFLLLDGSSEEAKDTSVEQEDCQKLPIPSRNTLQYYVRP